MNILSQIVAHKQREVADRKSLYPLKLLEKSIFFPSKTVSLKHYIMRSDKVGVIAEFKRKSPSKGNINPYVSVERTSIGYMQAGASALSILTDAFYFGGSNEDLTIARKFNFCPILRKEFIIDEYQILEAKSIGADAILLIAAILDKDAIKALTAFAHALQLEVLLEVHSEEELRKVEGIEVDLIGVNNRNLDTFEVDINISKELASKIPDTIVKVSESGIDSTDTIMDLKGHGFQGFLIGQTFMQHASPEKACREFIQEIKKRISTMKMK
jgi:indole-3-glycerol phosphate synthase